MKEIIIGETIRGYHYVVTGSQLPIVRGNEIKSWVDTHLKYPWHSDENLTEQYKIKNEDGSFKRMKQNTLNKDFTYIILDDDTDMLYDQKDNFVNTDSLNGISDEDVEKAIQILNRI